MTDRPILFSGQMVRALLDGSKAQTRRVIAVDKSPVLKDYDCTGKLVEYEGHEAHGLEFVSSAHGLWSSDTNPNGRSAWYVPVKFRAGDRLWVRETFCWGSNGAAGSEDWPIYKAEYSANGDTSWKLFKPWKPSIFMPRRANRLVLPVTVVRVERLQDISESDAIKEGIEGRTCLWKNYQNGRRSFMSPKDSFRTLWDGINGQTPGKAWADNPFVAAIEFTVIKSNIDNMEGP